MPSQGSLTFYEYNDETVLATIYEDVGKTTPLDLTGKAVEFIIKSSNSVDDSTGLTIPADVTNAPGGEITISLDAAQINLTRKFFRIDVVTATDRKTAIYGSVTIVDL